MSGSSSEAVAALAGQISLVLAGKERVVNQALIALLSGGHLLIEDLPGMGKTTLAHALAASLDTDFGRIQFTADLLPADIVGVEIFDPGEKRFIFHPGPVFHHIVLADEINRATPKAQSALLEAMAEGQVSCEGESRGLPDPFFVIATQNPMGHQGTYPLPESQLDRFFMRLSIGYSDHDAERKLLSSEAGRTQLESVEPVASWQDVADAQHQIAALHVSDALMNYLLELLQASRNGKWLRQGISPRAGRDLLQAARAHGWMDGRDYVTATDLQSLWLPLLAHRVVAVGESEAALLNLLEQVAVPG